MTPEQKAKLESGLQPVMVAGSSANKPPAHIRLISKFRKPEDRGPGDTFERLVDPLGGKVIKRLLGDDCGCEERKKDWNQKYGYEKEG